MEDFYREIYAVNGITDIKFPEHYSVSRLLGCVEVVGYLKCEELVGWEAVPESVRLEDQQISPKSGGSARRNAASGRQSGATSSQGADLRCSGLSQEDILRGIPSVP
ncbi:uncharacterized protein A4U43_UnF10330 [Asparagus officinalis]|uniref:Uncharacterized protein n=1 Tax=Asparagus officinalis TaxID=4686 RepID=A0A1R3L5I7_ASPOF|nr:uncharacterized protein A4U43_UnF10330 [Asparagus officinalis]